MHVMLCEQFVQSTEKNPENRTTMTKTGNTIVKNVSSYKKKTKSKGKTKTDIATGSKKKQNFKIQLHAIIAYIYLQKHTSLLGKV